MSTTSARMSTLYTHVREQLRTAIQYQWLQPQYMYSSEDKPRSMKEFATCATNEAKHHQQYKIKLLCEGPRSTRKLQYKCVI